jgi:hypothetical protein
VRALGWRNFTILMSIGWYFMCFIAVTFSTALAVGQYFRLVGLGLEKLVRVLGLLVQGLGWVPDIGGRP